MTIAVITKGTVLQQMTQDPVSREGLRRADQDPVKQALIVLYDHLAAIFRAPQSTPEGER